MAMQRKIIEFQQYLFDTLWNKAIPAEQRIRELEEGEPPENYEIMVTEIEAEGEFKTWFANV